ncbi:ABC transporter ATP-binding protein [Mycoplasma sp. CSL7503-lung]|uniref:ABC transporter ATP-binding protein n=1 Tax=Mycoplasma sp. CSL7503-lung TaxID=536372 RepID=UPI0021D063C1|nr:ABC transporter ATP-binding protein [Mycoplasma sp. CSL7503-lung]MCU4706363.1 ABC transporter ATP-binding protein [Mycoplasma sp. CSL7503-lung]
MKEKLLDIKDLRVSFKLRRNKFITIVRGVDIELNKGEIIGIVGESGSGKTVTSKSFLNINENAVISSEKMEIEGIDLTQSKKEKFWQTIRGHKIGYIPQDPLTSLNPTRKIGKQLIDALNKNEDWKNKPYSEKRKYLVDLLVKFGINGAEQVFDMYPHTLSGGMKQRVVITMVVALKPSLIIADEPTTALDPTVQASVLALFEDIRSTMDISIILISHNISVVAKFCDYIYVMYAGKIVERGSKKDIFTDPRHPYTWALISAIPENKDDRLYSIKGTPPDMNNLPLGDSFAPRNDYAVELDFIKEPPLFEVSQGHWAATWLLHPDAPKVKLSEELETRLNHFRKVFSDETK